MYRSVDSIIAAEFSFIQLLLLYAFSGDLFWHRSDVKIREYTKTAPEYAVHHRKRCSVIRERYILVCCRLHAVCHLAFTQHAAAAVYHKAVRRKVFGEIPAGTQTDAYVLSGGLF